MRTNVNGDLEFEDAFVMLWDFVFGLPKKLVQFFNGVKNEIHN